MDGRARQGLGIAFALFAALSISLSFVLARPVYDSGVAPLLLVALRPLAFLVPVALVLGLAGRRLAPSRGKLLETWAIGLAYLVGTGGYLWSVDYLPVSLAVLIFYSYPFMTLLLQALLSRRAPLMRDLLALLAALAGLVLALGVSAANLDPRGIALALTGALGVAVSFTAMDRRLGGEDTLAVTLQMALAGAVVAGLAAAVSGSLVLPQGGATQWLLLAGLLGASILGFFSMFRGVALIGALRTSTIMNLEPVATIALALPLLGQQLEPRQWAGAVLVIFAVAASQWRRRVLVRDGD